MYLRFFAALFGVCLILALARPTAAADPEAVKADEKTLREASLSTDSAALLDFFRKRTLADNYRDKIVGLIEKMGDDSFRVREQAFADLLALGPAAAPLLRQAQQTSTDIEIVRRSERCLQLIEKSYNAALALAAARLLAVRKPEQTTEVLLGYLPCADEEQVIEEIRNTLVIAGFQDRQPDKALVDALQEKHPVRRGIAGEVLARAGSDEHRAAARKLLKDPDASVRLRVGLALIEHKDREAVPVLIGLLAEVPLEQCWKVEDILYRLADEQAPSVSLGSTDDSRRKYRDAWSGWWTKNGTTVDLKKLDEAPRLQGLLLFVEMQQGVQGRVREVGKDGKVRWQIENLTYPIDAQVTGPDRVVIAEYSARRVSERDFKGNIIWQKNLAAAAGVAASYPMTVQRLSNGNTVIAARGQILEVDRNGKDVFTHNRPGQDIMAGGKSRDGQYVFVTRTGQCIRLDGAGKEVKSFAVGLVQMIGANIEVLPNGNVLIPQSGTNKVSEYDASGKVIWEVGFNQPTSVMRLPNGNTLIASMYNQQAVEVDRSGKEVRQIRSDSPRLMRVRER